MPRSRTRAIMLSALLVAGCGGSDSVPGFSRETRADGRTIMSYAAGLPAREDTLVPMFTIGKYLNDSSQIFSDLRDLDVGPDGRIYVLDYKTSTIAVFDSMGNRVATLSRPGEGPGEISRANGIRFGPDGTLWVNDHGKGMILALDADGTERARYPSLVPGYGYRWDVLIDTAGVLWQSWSRQISGRNNSAVVGGLVQGTSLTMLKGFDPATGARDSIVLGEESWRSYSAVYPGGSMMTSLPFSGGARMAMDQHHRFWQTSPYDYSLSRMTTSLDTTLELRVAATALPVTEKDIAKWKQAYADEAKRAPTLIADLMEYMPKNKPLFTQMFSDDQDRLWLGRTVADGEPARWDVFASNGEFLTSVCAPAGTTIRMQPVIRGDRIYLLATGEAGERYVVVAGVGGMSPES